MPREVEREAQPAWAGWVEPLPAPATRSSTRLGGSSRVALVAVHDAEKRALLTETLRWRRWEVRSCETAVALLEQLEASAASLVVLGSWFPDLDRAECVALLEQTYPWVALLDERGEALHASEASRVVHAEVIRALRDGDSEPTVHPEVRLDSQAGGNELAPAPPRELAPVSVVPYHSSCADPRLDQAARQTAETGSDGGMDADLGELLGTRSEMVEVRRRIRLVAARRTTVLVHGPSGTGKELVAQAIHRLSGRTGPLVVINCAAIPEALVESELFGYARGAFTGAERSRGGRIEAAAGGTLFLDEIGELPLAVQGKLLRFLECGELQRVGENGTITVDARVVAATHRPLAAMARGAAFRADLLHRLSVFVIRTPALAGDAPDLDRLIGHTLRTLAGAAQVPSLSPAARARLHAHPWPGNVRELRHTIERALILADGADEIGVDCLEFCDGLFGDELF